MKYVLIAGAIICAAAILFSALKTKRPFRSLLISGAGGVAALAVIMITGMFTGVTLAFNGWSLLCAVCAGIPGVVLMLAMKAFWNF